MNKKLISEEILRIREMMGFSSYNKRFLTEGVGKLLADESMPGGIVDDLASMGKTVDDIFSYSTKLANDFPTKTFDSIIDRVAKENTIDSASVTNEMMRKFIATQPGLMDEIMTVAAKIADESTTLKISDVSFQDVFTKAGLEEFPENLKNTLATKITDINKDTTKKILDQFEKLLDGNIKIKNTPEAKELSNKIRNKRAEILDYEDYKTKKSSNVDVAKNVTEKEDGFGEGDFQDFKKNWTREDVGGVTDPNQYSVVKNSAEETFKNLPETFNPSEIKRGRVNSYKFIQNDESTNFQDVLRSRTQMEVTLPNGKKTLMYSSSGSNVGTTGKEAGEWFWIPGIARSGWYIKTTESVAYTKGGNQYMTDFAKYLENNGYNGLSKEGTTPSSVSKIASNVTPTSTNRLQSIVGDTSKINWSVINNAKNVEDYNKFIDDAIATNNYMKISRAGFEEYGIPNFRKHLMDLDLKAGDNSIARQNGSQNELYKMNREIFDLYQAEGGTSDTFMDWLTKLPEDQLEDIYNYINSKKQ